MDFNIVLICTVLLGVFALIINFFRNKSVNKLIEQNKDTPQLFLQKTVDNKLRTIQHALRQNVTGDLGELNNDPEVVKMKALRLTAGEELNELKESYKSKKITLKAYDHKLDLILRKLNENVIY